MRKIAILKLLDNENNKTFFDPSFAILCIILAALHLCILKLLDVVSK